MSGSRPSEVSSVEQLYHNGNPRHLLPDSPVHLQLPLNEHKSLSRSKINELVLDYLPADRDLQNKIYKIGNLLAKLKRRQQIYLNCNKEWSLKE